MIPANNSPTTEGSPIRWKTSPSSLAATKIITTLTKSCSVDTPRNHIIMGFIRLEGIWIFGYIEVIFSFIMSA